MTHGDATDFLEHQVVPKQFLHMVSKPKAQKKSVAKKKSSTKKDSGLERLNVVEKRVDDMDNKLSQILEILSKK